MITEFAVNTSQTLYYNPDSYVNIFGLGSVNLKENKAFVRRWHSCRDEFVRNLGEYSCWFYVIGRRCSLENTIEYLQKSQESMKISKRKHFEIGKDEKLKCIVIMPSAFWKVPLRASLFSLLCRASRHYNPENKDVISPLRHSTYLRSKSALLAAERFIQGEVNVSSSGSGWRDYFSGRKLSTIDELLGVKNVRK